MFNRLKKFRFSDFARNTRGQVAIIFGLSIIPIVSIVGFTIDFQQTTTQKGKVQAVIDSAVMAGARAMQAGKSQQEIKEVMHEYLIAQRKQNATSTTLWCSGMKVTFGEDSKDINVSVDCEQETSMMQMVGKKTMDFNVSSTSTWGIGKLDVAFMFDVSGSMASNNRMTNLKSAANEAIDTLMPPGDDPTAGETRIAMISYNDMVNAGDYFEDVTGMEATRTYHATNTWTSRERVAPFTEEYQDWQCQRVWTCTSRYKRGRKKGQCKRGYWTDADCGYQTEVRDVYNYENVTHSEPKSKTITSTCVWERIGDKEFSDTAPSTSGSAVDDIYGANKPIYNAADPDGTNPEGYLSAGYTYWDDEDDKWRTSGTSCRNHKPVGLTNNRGTLKGYVNGLTTGGGTAGHQGIAWSWYMVAEPWQSIHGSSNQPLDYDEPDSTKAIILMSDGDFLHQEFDELGTSVEQARRVCEAIKAQGDVIIYTVAFQAPEGGRDILDYCASGPEFSFTPESGEELTQAYKAIASSISDLRIKF